MEWVASTFHTTSEHGVSSITITDAHNSAASSRQFYLITVTICCHKTDLVRFNGHDRIILVIFSQALYKAA